MFLFLLIIFIHESGHYFFSRFVKFKYSKIVIYPFGGLTEYDEDLNVNLNKEFISLLGGIVFQILFYLLIIKLYKYEYITTHVYLIIKKINFILISFNFMPIIPLDGGKLLNIILDKFFSYRLSNIISLIISFFFILYFCFYEKSIFGIILTVFLIKSIYLEVINLNYKFNKFILERYLNNYKFKKIKKVNNINRFKRDYYHIINDAYERDFLNKLFDRKV